MLPSAMIADLSPLQWAMAILAGVGVGIAKAGLAGVGLVPVMLFAAIFGARDSTGITLPVLIVGDVMAAVVYRRHAHWPTMRRMLVPSCLGVATGAWAMQWLGDLQFRPVLGTTVLALAGLQALRSQRPQWFQQVPRSVGFTWTIGLLAGVMTMLTNAAGPVLVVYALAIGLPKWSAVGTIGWYFLLINLFKVPFSAALGLLHGSTLALALILAPAVALGLLVGRWTIHRIPQDTFNHVLLAGAAVAALRLIGVF